MATAKRAHRHRWRASWTSNDLVGYSCACGERFSRKADAVERRRIRAEQRSFFRPPRHANVHYVWHRMPFPKNFEELRDQDAKLAVGKKIAAFAKKHPKQIFVLGCDDSWHANSDLILVTHEARDKWMGISVVMIPQCDGRPPAEFFLYPCDLDPLVERLREFQRRARGVKRQERRRERARLAWWDRRNPRSELAVQE